MKTTSITLNDDIRSLLSDKIDNFTIKSVIRYDHSCNVTVTIEKKIGNHTHVFSGKGSTPAMIAEQIYNSYVATLKYLESLKLQRVVMGLFL